MNISTLSYGSRVYVAPFLAIYSSVFNLSNIFMTEEPGELTTWI